MAAILADPKKECNACLRLILATLERNNHLGTRSFLSLTSVQVYKGEKIRINTSKFLIFNYQDMGVLHFITSTIEV